MSESKGLGDTVEKITEATGLKSLMELAYGKKDCGCNKRKKWLNNNFPYKNNNK